MAGLIVELMDCLSSMSAYISELSELSRQKKNIIVKNDTETLKSITSKENTLVGKYQRTERSAAVLMKDIALVLNEKPAALTLTRLGELIREQDDYAAYIQLVDRLKDSLAELKGLNESNRVLLENALDYIDYTVNALRSAYGEDINVLDTKN